MGHITTFSGENFTPLTPSTDHIKLEDIAHALSLICRANGHLIKFFSVAQHSINCCYEAQARGLSAKIQLACLLHDASQAYISNIPRPVKKKLPKLIEAEAHIQELIYNKFFTNSVCAEERTVVKQIDDDMTIYEFMQLMKKKTNVVSPTLFSNPSFEFTCFSDIETEFSKLAISLK